MTEPMQVCVDEEGPQAVVCADDDQCHLGQVEALNERSVECVMKGTDHTFSLHNVLFSPQQSDGWSEIPQTLSTNDLLKSVAEGQGEDVFFCDILWYLNHQKLPNKEGCAWHVAMEVAQCFVCGGVLYCLWWPQRADVMA